ncbi:hypothetical protein [Deinococcus radiotolerans]|uniref:Uncharacterized protein n=1 Tax=Deinococcus radiotolerans TaxID=1309407 RepID=A0ABQ2FQY2_9DEIO|nr:hypothetical protein [Deinococcus radiotolerans]GGL18253.1 hypothetical protein GCM10010844_41400 [Deinococcus radiotolerans]
MNWQNRYLIVGGTHFGVAAPDPETGFVKAKPERNLTLIASAAGLSLAQLPPGITATRITVAGGTNIAVPNAVADVIRNLLPGQRVTISENYTLSTGRVWVDAIVTAPFDTTLHAVKPGPDGVPVEQYFTYSGFEALVLGGPA